MTCRGRPGLALALTALIAAIVLIAQPVSAANDPTFDWWTIETEHFRIHYEKNLEPVAEHLARLSEDIHGRLVGPLGYNPDDKTEVALTDVTDAANGSATALPFNTIRLFVTAPGDLSPLGDYEDWMLGLMTHEYVHILHVDNVSGIPSVVNSVIGKNLIPNQVQPRWIIEGLATMLETRYTSGGRVRSSLFDMQLRADFLEDNVATLAEISSDARRWPQGTLWYLYGSRFMRWITDIYGQDVWRAVSADYGASLIPWGINRAIRRQTGRTYVELYDGFKESLRREYHRQMLRVKKRGLREGKRLTHHGFRNFYPQFVPDRARTGGGPYQIDYTRDDSHERQGIYRIDLSDGEDGEEIDETFIVRTLGSSPVAYTPDGDMVFTSVVPFRRIYRRHDLFQLPKGETATRGWESYRDRLTVGLRARAPTISPDGRHVVFSRNDRGTTRLMVADRSATGELSHVRTLVRNQPFDQAFTPAFSPDGHYIAYSAWRAGGFRDIRLVDLRSGAEKNLTSDRAMDMQPVWSADGSKIYFSSDRTGIFNIYELELATGELAQVTNVRTGAMMPAVSEDGELLAYVGYTSKGYDLWVMKLDSARYLEPTAVETDRPDAYAPPPPVAMDKRRYSPWRTLRPRNFGFSTEPGNFSANQFTLTLAGSDIASQHAFEASMTIDPSAPGPQFGLSYAYLRFPFDLGLGLSNRYTPRSDFRIGDTNPVYTERAYNIRSSISYADLGEFVTQRVGLSHTASFIDPVLPADNLPPLDPYASVTRAPLDTFLSTLRASWGAAMVEGSYWTPGPVRGWAVSLGLDMADRFTGSDESFYSADFVVNGYLPMPWPGYHTLAVRSSGGMSTGSFSRRGVFFVGGYNLEGASITDRLLSTIFNGAFVLRGYEPSTYRGRAFLLNNLEYRVPLANPDFGIQTLPFFLRRVDLNLFMDWGGAWNELDYDGFTFFDQGAIINHPDLHTGVGAEIWLGVTLGYVLPIQMRLGHAVGLSSAAIPGGRTYFIASSPF